MPAADRAPARCPGCEAPTRPADPVCAACGRRLRAPGLALRVGGVVVRFRAVKGADGWHAEGRRADALRAAWHRLSVAHPDPHACLGHAAGRALRWLAAERDTDLRQELACLVRVDGLAGALRVLVGPANGGAWSWQAVAEPLPANDGWWGAPGLPELWAAVGGGPVVGLGRDRGESAAAAVARALARVDGALSPMD